MTRDLTLVERAYRALKVLTTTPHIANYLLQHDPQAYAQAVHAQTGLEPWVAPEYRRVDPVRVRTGDDLLCACELCGAHGPGACVTLRRT